MCEVQNKKSDLKINEPVSSLQESSVSSAYKKANLSMDTDEVNMSPRFPTHNFRPTDAHQLHHSEMFLAKSKSIFMPNDEKESSNKYIMIRPDVVEKESDLPMNDYTRQSIPGDDLLENRGLGSFSKIGFHETNRTGDFHFDKAHPMASEKLIKTNEGEYLKRTGKVGHYIDNEGKENESKLESAQEIKKKKNASDRSHTVSSEQISAERKEQHQERLLRYINDYETFGGRPPPPKRSAKGGFNKILDLLSIFVFY